MLRPKDIHKASTRKWARRCSCLLEVPAALSVLFLCTVATTTTGSIGAITTPRASRIKPRNWQATKQARTLCYAEARQRLGRPERPRMIKRTRLVTEEVLRWQPRQPVALRKPPHWFIAQKSSPAFSFLSQSKSANPFAGLRE